MVGLDEAAGSSGVNSDTPAEAHGQPERLDQQFGGAAFGTRFEVVRGKGVQAFGCAGVSTDEGEERWELGTLPHASFVNNEQGGT